MEINILLPVPLFHLWLMKDRRQTGFPALPDEIEHKKNKATSMM
jgi:hypothetical protein